MALTVPFAKFDVRIHIPERNTDVGIDGAGVVPYDHKFEYTGKFRNGTGANKVGVVFSGRFSISAAEDHDLRGGLLSVASGSNVPFPIVCGVFLKNLSTTTGQYVTIGGGSNPFISWLGATGDGIRVGPGGFFSLWSPVDGYATTADTADILRVTPVTGTIAYELCVVGRGS